MTSIHIDTSVFIDGTYVLQKNNTVGHFHTDPKLITQSNVNTILKIGQFVYVDVDGLYKPAIATSRRSSNVIGFVYEIIGSNAFYLKHSQSHVFFRNPLPPNWFNYKITGEVDEKSPSTLQLPSILGNPLYLSDTIAGGMMVQPPDNEFAVCVGFKTDYGFIYKPEPYCCLPASF